MTTRFYRRNLPHWRVDGATYFLTWRLARGQADLTADERTAVLEALMHLDGDRYQLVACVVMNDHVHALVAPASTRRIEDIVRSWKSFTTNALWRVGRIGQLWQEEYFDRVVRDDEELLEKMSYIAKNPRKRWPDLEEYAWLVLPKDGGPLVPEP